jgi:transcriptional regulator with XRE-family HTH domain
MVQTSTARQAEPLPEIDESDATKFHPVDIEVGMRIRLRRLHLRMSQTALGGGVGISFQQVQKYERGVNRVSSSVLYEIANVLDVPMSYFFETLPRPGKGNTESFSHKADIRQEFVATDEGQRLVDAFMALPQKTRAKSIALLAAIGTADP